VTNNVHKNPTKSSFEVDSDDLALSSSDTSSKENIEVKLPSSVTESVNIFYSNHIVADSSFITNIFFGKTIGLITLALLDFTVSQSQARF